jgi:NAD(P)H-dependent flavin oxidoreductase YrpB (nitropropane dioxygenase family)
MNEATRRLGIAWPIVQAPIGSASTPALAAAVSNAGGLGMLAGSWRSAETWRESIAQTRELTAFPFGVNFVLALDPGERLRIALDAGVAVVSFFWGDPSPWIVPVHRAGAVVVHTVGSGDEARAAAGAGVDVLVAQGVEAGGHVRGETPLVQLLADVRSAAPGLPVFAAGGIADASDVRTALAAGADGVWVGTRFVASAESAAHADYKRRIVEATATDTVLTDLFDLGWPDAPHRVIRNSTVRKWEMAGRPSSGHRPGEGESIAHHGDGRAVMRYEDTPPIEGMSGNLEALPHYAGKSVERIDRVLPAAEIVHRLSAGMR